jgi:hypothetical protein
MAFLAPLFLAGLAALAIPVIIHLVQRERKQPIAFPSLMFVQRIPYQSVRRRRVRNWPLLLLRAAALALIALAFARPFFRSGALAAANVAAGAREVVVLLDVSASMGYGDHFARAQAAAKKVMDGLGAADRATLVLFAQNADERVRATGDHVRLDAAVDGVRVTSGGTRYGPALRLAQSLLARSDLGRREAVLISDFQKSGWQQHEEVHFPGGTVLTPVSVASVATSNVSVTSVAFERARFAGEERVTVTAGLVNRSADPVTNLPVTLEVGGQQIQAQHANLPPHGSASVVFAQFTLSDAYVRGSVHAGTDAMPKDNVFYFALSPARPLSVLIVQPDGGGGADTVYLTTALGIGNPPPFQAQVMPVSRVTSAVLEKTAVVVLNDVTVPSPVGALLKQFVELGGGVLAVLGEHASGLDSGGVLLPGTLGPPRDVSFGRTGTLGFIDYTHTIFEIFKTPHSGDFSIAHFSRYRPIETGPSDRVLARFDDGVVALAERKVGGGHVIAFGSTLDESWNDLPVKSVFLPLLHQIVRYLARYQEQPAWQTAGQVVDPSERLPELAPDANGVRHATGMVLSPSGERRTTGDGITGMSLQLDEQGFYEVRIQGQTDRRPFTVAVNIDPVESDLTTMDLQEFVAAATGQAAPGVAKPPDLTAKPEDAERRQSIWWFLLFAGLLALIGEAVLSNRLSSAATGAARLVRSAAHRPARV